MGVWIYLQEEEVGGRDTTKRMDKLFLAQMFPKEKEKRRPASSRFLSLRATSFALLRLRLPVRLPLAFPRECRAAEAVVAVVVVAAAS